MKTSDSIRSFLTQRPNDLIDRIVTHPGLECQVNVSQGDGERVAGKRGTYSDGVNSWWNIRIPKNADSEPNWTDYDLKFPLESHAEAIGFTGWDWQQKRSVFVGFDFDAITGHAVGVGVTDDDLAAVRQAVEEIPWVEVRRSKSGRGLHLYVWLGEPVETHTHTEHAALARCILGILSQRAEFDFASQVDACGAVLWAWHRQTLPGGFEPIKLAAEQFVDVPTNWRDHVPVIRRKRSKVEIDGGVERLAATQQSVALLDEHNRVIDALTATGYSTNWVQDHGLLQTHTKALEQIHTELKLRGIFCTNSPGNDPTSFNCFLFPVEDGSWKVYRFGQGISESPTWQQDGNGWTTCRFNCDPTLQEASLGFHGVSGSDGSYHFDMASQAVEAIRMLGCPIELPEKLSTRTSKLKQLSDGRLNLMVREERGETKPEGWAPKRGGWWEKVLNVRLSDKPKFVSVLDQDDYLRYTLSALDGKPIGWLFRGPDAIWSPISTDHVKLVLASRHMSDAETKQMLGSSLERPWRQVCVPFATEHPGGRQWNLNAPQLAYDIGTDDDHPTWDLVLGHCFGSLDEPLKELEWSKRTGIRTGRDYAISWLAALIRDPFAPLPYLFFFGPENSGKSTFHEAVSLLLTRGVVIADQALTSKSGFNGELADAILCVIEEKNLRGDEAYSRIKEYVTGKAISIHAKGRTPYTRPNMTHWCQFANSDAHCPVFPGDTRIVVLKVDTPEEEVPKDTLLDKLRQEAPNFLYSLLNTPLAPLEGRLRLPAIGTTAKERIEQGNRTALEAFLTECCESSDGCKIEFKEFYNSFCLWAESDALSWSKMRVSKSLPDQYKTVAGTGNRKFILNLRLKSEELVSV